MYYGVNDRISRSIRESDAKKAHKNFIKNKASKRNVRKKIGKR